MIHIDFWPAYRKFLVVFAVAIFFTNFADFSKRFGLIPLFWIAVFAALSLPAILRGLYLGQIAIPPLMIWGLFYAAISILWYYRTPQDGKAFQETQTRIVSVIFLALCLIVCNRPEEQRFARQWIAAAVLFGTALNVYELFHPMTFSTIPGRSTGLYSNVDQSGAALVLGLILGYQVVPDRFKMLFIMIAAAGIIPTFARTSMIGWIVVVSYFWLRAGLQTQIKRVITFGIVGIAFIYSPIWENLQASLKRKGVLNLDVLQRITFFTNGNLSDDSANERKAVAMKAWALFGERPLLGWGTGASRRIEGFSVGTHNIYLAMIVDHGVIGFFVMPFLILAILWGANRKTIDVTIPYVMFLVIWGFFSHNVLEDPTMLLSFALLAAIVASNRVPAPETAVVPSTAIATGTA